MLVGGKSAEHDATEEVQALLDGLKDEIKNHIGDLSELRAVKYATQVVRGTNYFIKAHVGNNRFIHARVHKDLPVNESKVTLHSVQKDKGESDPIDFF